MNNSQYKKSGERGIYLILVAFLAMAILGFCVLVLGLGMMTTDRTRLINIANLAALAGLEAFIEANPSSLPPEQQNDQNFVYHWRELKAVQRVEQILVANGNLPGIPNNLGVAGNEMTSRDGMQLELGSWVRESYNDEFGVMQSPCGDDIADYPCFVANDGAQTTANAVRLRIGTREPDNLLTAPFAKIYGNDKFSIHATGLATLILRSTAYLLDVSPSATEATHYSFNSNGGTAVEAMHHYCSCSVPDPIYVDLGLWSSTPSACTVSLCPGNMSPAIAFKTPNTSGLSQAEIDQSRFYARFAYRGDGNFGLDNLYFNNTTFAWPCRTPTDRITWGPGFTTWCNMYEVRGSARHYNGISTQQHFRSDYRPINVNGTTYYFDQYFESYDSYFGPQPLTQYLLAINAGLRQVEVSQSPGDSASVAVFAGRRIDCLPNDGSGGAGGPNCTLAHVNQLGRLVQVTNFMNRGVIDAVGNPIPLSQGAEFEPRSENALSKGWFPVVGVTDKATTDIIGAIYDAINTLSRSPQGSIKSIVIASDGKPTCAYAFANASSNYPTSPSDCTPSSEVHPTTGSEFKSYYTNYQSARSSLLNQVLKELKHQGIRLTVLLDSESVQPNFRNIKEGDEYLSITKALDPSRAPESRYCIPGIPGTSCDPTKAIIDISSETGLQFDERCADSERPDCQSDDRYAFDHASEARVKFRDPNAIWAYMAYETGGVICPIMPRCHEVPGATGNPHDYYYDTGPRNGQLKPEFRTEGAFQTCSVTYDSKTDQAVKCVLNAVGTGNPYQNVEEEQ